MDQKLKNSNEPESPLRLISCIRPDLIFTFAPQKGWPKAQGLCGHDVYQREQIMLGELIVARSNKDRFSATERDFGFTWQKCFACLGRHEFKYAIICATCGRIILRGQPVSLYEASGDTSGNPFFRHATRTLIGEVTVNCMDWECCPSVDFFSGHWRGDGILSPYITGTSVSDLVAECTKGPTLTRVR